MTDIERSRPQFTVLSPDGIAISHDAVFDTLEDASAALAAWCERYRMQGYYRDARWDNIPVHELAGHCTIIRL
jgi:hypothetical protein